MDSVIQASEAELERGLKERNVVEVDGTFALANPQLKAVEGRMLIISRSTTFTSSE